MKPQQLAALIALLTIGAIVTAILARPRLGLDIKGGARVVLEAETDKLPKGQKWDDESKRAVLATINNRVNANGVSEPIITPKGDKQYVVEIPAVRNRDDILQQLQNTAQLEFYYSKDWVTQRNPYGRYDINQAGDDGKKRESFTVTDTRSKTVFRDLFHINAALGELLANSAKGGETAKNVTLPAPLGDLAVSGGKPDVRLTDADAAKLPALADELKNFNSFLSAANLELTGRDLAPGGAGSNLDPTGTGALVELGFNGEGRTKFANFTRDHSQEILMIYLDGRILMAPNIDEPILNGKAQIRPFGTLREAKELAAYLNGGALPVPLKIVQQQTVEATIGSEAVRHGFTAGAVGLGAVILFMAGYYMLPGLVACFALVIYTLLTYAVFLLIPVTFTLPGIAGFILSVGMAVDANVLIFERTKEELRDGRPLKQAIESGFQRAFSAIFDSNMCTAVTSLLLYYFGTGPVRGFALTLLIGVAISMFTAITVTRTLLLLLVRPGAQTNLTAWGANRSWKPNFNIVGKRGLWYALSLAIIVPGLAFYFGGGFKKGIEFTGGSELTVSMNRLHNREEIEKAVSGLGFADPAVQIAGGDTYIIRLPQKNGKNLVNADADRLVSGLQSAFPNDAVTRQEFSSIGSSISNELTRNAFTSVLLSSLFIVFYLAFRFAIGGFANGLKFGVGAIIAMLHDVLVLIGVFSILGYVLNWKVDSLFVTAALTVIGFSVHDTIIIFDRIRENLKARGNRSEFGALVNDSINETFTRSINTSFTVIITLLALIIFGGPVIRPLNVALLIGIVSGTYSSIFNAAPLVVDWQKRFGARGQAIASGTGGGSAPSSTPRPAPAPRTPATTAPTSTGGARAFPAPNPGATPRSTTNGDGGSTTGGGYIGGNGASTAPPPGPGAVRPRKRRM